MPPSYVSVGKCIYCRSPVYSEAEPTHKLGDEHLVPRGFGGTILLPDASCKKHEIETSKIEDHCVRHLLVHARPHLNLRGRKSKRVPDFGNFNPSPGTSRRVPKDDHPGYLIDYTYPYPNFLLGQKPPYPKGEAFIHLRPTVTGFESRVIGLGGKIHVKLGEKESLETYAKLLAKIAHVYAVGELGIDAFDPWLPPLISGKESVFGMGDLVGTGIPEPPSMERHEVRFAPLLSVGGAIVVRVRLFSNLSNASNPHYVVVGKPV